MFQLGNDFAAFFATGEFKRHLALHMAPCCALLAQFFQAAHPAFVAGAPRFDAFAYPRFFLGVEFVEQAVVFGFHGQLLRFFNAVLRKRAGIAAHDAAIELDNAGGDVVEKAAVMGNHQ